MITIEKILTRVLVLFLKYLSIELSHLVFLTNHLPKKSILRISSPKNLELNRRKVFFTHIDSFEFDPRYSCGFTCQPQRKQFYMSITDQQMRCLCHHQSKINSSDTKSKIKLKR